MKNAIGIVLLIVTILVVLMTNLFSYETEIVYLDSNEINNIEVVGGSVKLNISSADIDNIIVEISENSYSDSSIFYYVEEDTLYIKEYYDLDSNLFSTAHIINIYIPKEKNLSNLTINLENGKSKIEGIKVDNIHISGENNNTTINNIVFKNITDISSYSNFKIKNSIGNEILIDNNKGSSLIERSTISKVDINYEKRSDIVFSKSLVDELNIDAPSSYITLMLDETKNYSILGNDGNKIRYTDSIEYMGNEDEEYKLDTHINIYNGRIKKIEYN